MVEGKGERWNESEGAIGESYKVIFEEADPEKEGTDGVCSKGIRGAVVRSCMR
jgi:hypothetical protein